MTHRSARLVVSPDLAVVPEIVGEINRGHAAGAKLALDSVPVGECRGQALEAHRVPPALVFIFVARSARKFSM